MQVHLIAEDVCGNMQPESTLVNVLTGKDTSPPIITGGPQQCGQTFDLDSLKGEINGIKETQFRISIKLNEAGSVYYLVAESQPDDIPACQDLQILPGSAFSVPLGEKWSGCSSMGAPSRRLRHHASGLASQFSEGDQQSESTARKLHTVGSVPTTEPTPDDSDESPTVRLLLSVPDRLQNPIGAGCLPDIECMLSYADAWMSTTDIASIGTQIFRACVSLPASAFFKLPFMDVLLDGCVLLIFGFITDLSIH